MLNRGAFNPKRYIQVIMPWGEMVPRVQLQKIDDALQSECPQLSAFNAYMGRDYTITQLVDVFKCTRNLVNIKGNLTAEQVFFLAEELIGNYWHLKLTDIALCLKKGFTGEYGQIYDRVDVQVVMEWVRKYDTERQEHIEHTQRNNSAAMKKDPPITSEEAAANFKRMAEIMRSAIKTPPPAPDVSQDDQEERQRNLMAYKLQMMDEAKRREELKELGMIKEQGDETGIYRQFVFFAEAEAEGQYTAVKYDGRRVLVSCPLSHWVKELDLTRTTQSVAVNSDFVHSAHIGYHEGSLRVYLFTPFGVFEVNNRYMAGVLEMLKQKKIELKVL